MTAFQYGPAPGGDYVPQLFHRTDSFRFLTPAGRMSVQRVAGGQMVLARVTSTGHDITLEEPDRLTLLFPWAGRITCAVQDDMMAADAGGVLAFAPNRRRTVVQPPRQRGPFLADVLTLPIATLHALQRSEDLHTARITRPHPATGAALARIRHRAARILREATGAPATGHAMTFDDLAMDLALALADPDRLPASAGRRRVAQAIALMHDRHAEPVSMVALARDLGCSSRSLQLAFRAAGHPPPQEVLTGIRLDAARVRLLADGCSVTESALDSGFNHLGRFAQAYRRRFGERPADTLSAGA